MVMNGKNRNTGLLPIHTFSSWSCNLWTINHMPVVSFHLHSIGAAQFLVNIFFLFKSLAKHLIYEKEFWYKSDKGKDVRIFVTFPLDFYLSCIHSEEFPKVYRWTLRKYQ